MNDIDGQLVQSPPMLDRPGLLEEVRVRLSAITNTLADVNMEAGQLRTTSQDLVAVAHRIEWLADLTTPPRSECNRE